MYIKRAYWTKASKNTIATNARDSFYHKKIAYISVVKLAAGRGRREVSELQAPPTEPKRPRMLRQFRVLVVLPRGIWQLVSENLVVIEMSTVA